MQYDARQKSTFKTTIIIVSRQQHRDRKTPLNNLSGDGNSKKNAMGQQQNQRIITKYLMTVQLHAPAR